MTVDMTPDKLIDQVASAIKKMMITKMIHAEQILGLGIGGPLISTNELFFDIAERVARRKTYYSNRYCPEFRKAKLGEDSIAYGSALMMIDQLVQ